MAQLKRIIDQFAESVLSVESARPAGRISTEQYAVPRRAVIEGKV